MIWVDVGDQSLVMFFGCRVLWFAAGHEPVVDVFFGRGGAISTTPQMAEMAIHNSVIHIYILTFSVLATGCHRVIVSHTVSVSLSIKVCVQT